MTKYLQHERFFSPANSDAYRDGWERTFGKKSKCGSLIRSVSGDPCEATADGSDGLCYGCRAFNALCEQHDYPVNEYGDGSAGDMPDTDAIECRLKSYANLVAPLEAKIDVSGDLYFIPRHLDNTNAMCRNSMGSLPLVVLEEHDCCYTCNDFAADPSPLLRSE